MWAVVTEKKNPDWTETPTQTAPNSCVACPLNLDIYIRSFLTFFTTPIPSDIHLRTEHEKNKNKENK